MKPIHGHGWHETAADVRQALRMAFGRHIRSRSEITTLLARLGAVGEAEDVVMLLPLVWTARRYLKGMILAPMPLRVPGDVRAAAERTMARIVAGMPPEAQPTFEAAVRRVFRDYRSDAVEGPDGCLYDVALPPADKIPPGNSRVAQLGVLSCHPNGRIRETAVREMAASDAFAALPFLFWRTTDWVEQVRSATRQILEGLSRMELAPHLVPLLPLIGRIEGKGASLDRSFLDGIASILLGEQGLSSLRAGLNAPSSKIRRAVCRMFDLAEPPLDVALKAAHDNDPVVRGWVLRWEARLRPISPGDAAHLLALLLDDRLPGIRISALRALIGVDGVDASLPRLMGALLDPAAGMRSLARFHLQDRGVDFAAIYRDALSRASRLKQLRAAAEGLGETGVPEDVPLLLDFLDGPLGVARPALRAAAKLDPDRIVGVLFERLTDYRLPIRSDVLRLLPRRLQENDAPILSRILGETSAEVDALVVAIGRLPPWDCLAALIGSLPHADERKRELIVAALEHWPSIHRLNYGTGPIPQDMVDGLEKALNRARIFLPGSLRGRIEVAVTSRGSSVR